MSNWEKVVEDGMEIWVNEDLGNVYKLPNGEFIAMIPKILKFGPFKSVEDGKKFVETKKQELSQALDLLNEKFVNEQQ